MSGRRWQPGRRRVYFIPPLRPHLEVVYPCWATKYPIWVPDVPAITFKDVRTASTILVAYWRSAAFRVSFLTKWAYGCYTLEVDISLGECSIYGSGVSQRHIVRGRVFFGEYKIGRAHV